VISEQNPDALSANVIAGLACKPSLF